MKRGGFESEPYKEVLASGFDPYHAFVGLVPYFVDLARSAAENEAVSYRNFHVGAALYAVNEGFTSVGIFDGANVKYTEDMQKRCAEMSVIDQARISGFSKAVGMVVAGTADSELIEAVTGKRTPTLHPCGACQKSMVKSGMFDETSIILTIGTNADVYQVHTYKELVDFYTRDDPTEIQESPPLDYDESRWQYHQAVYGRIQSEAGGKLSRHSIARLALASNFGASSQ